MTYNEFVSGVVYKDKYSTGRWRFVKKENDIFGVLGHIEKLGRDGKFEYDVSVFQMDETSASITTSKGGATLSGELVFADMEIVAQADPAHIGHA